MKFCRLSIFIAPLLAGCTLFSGIFSTPVSHKAPDADISDTGVDGLTASTAMTVNVIDSTLQHHYQLLDGMQMQNGKLVKFIEARKNGKPALQISGTDRGITRVIVLDPALKTDTGVKIGTTFSSIYPSAYNVCHKNDDSFAKDIICQAPGSQRLTYYFTGEWQGPDILLPANDILKTWMVSKIVWHNK